MRTMPFVRGIPDTRIGDTIIARIAGTPHSVKARILRQSGVTATLTIELQETTGAYKKGAAVHVKPWDCSREQA